MASLDICQHCGCDMNQEEKVLLEHFPLLYRAIKRKAGFSRRWIGGRVSTDDSAKSLGTPGKEILSKMWTKGA